MMKMEALKISKGTWIVREMPNDADTFFVQAPKNNPEDPYDIEVMGEDLTLYPLEQRRADADLIAEAGTVANETGLTPRQLADQNKELRKAIEKVVKAHNPTQMEQAQITCVEALKKAESN